MGKNDTTQPAAASTSGVSGVFAGPMGTDREFDPNVNKWEVYKKQLIQFFIINKITDDEIKRAILLNNISENAYSIVSDLLVPEDPEKVAYADIISKLDNHFGLKTSIWGERMIFYNAEQFSDESINDWAVRVRHLSANCQFGTHLNEALRDKFVFGMKKGRIMEKLLQEDAKTLTFTNAVEIAQGLEAAKSCYGSNFNDTEVKTEPQIYRVSASGTSNWVAPKGGRQQLLNRPGTSSRNWSNNSGNVPDASGSRPPTRDITRSNLNCQVCGKMGHLSELCRYRNYACNICREKGHLSSVCKNSRYANKKKSYFMEHENQDSRDIDTLNSDDFLHLFNIGTGDKDLPIKIKVNVEGLILNMELDSGSAVTALSNNFYSKYFSHIPISFSKTMYIN